MQRSTQTPFSPTSSHLWLVATVQAGYYSIILLQFTRRFMQKRGFEKKYPNYGMAGEKFKFETDQKPTVSIFT